LYYALDTNEFNRIFVHKPTKEVCDALATTYKGTSKVRESKISIYMHQYELFHMLPSEGVKGMYIRFSYIINKAPVSQKSLLK